MALVLNKNVLLTFNSDTLNEVRKEFNLDEHGKIEQEINTLHDWIQRQEYFTKKDFARNYLERFIISAKGSVERAQTRIDKLCTMRTIASNLFEKCVAKDLLDLRSFYLQVMIPDLTQDNYRMLCSKMLLSKVTSSKLLEAYQHCIMLTEYLKLHDYAQGYYLVLDLNDMNIMDIVFNLKLSDFRNIFTVIIEGYGIRIKGIYVISPSKMIDALVKIVKKFVSAKIAQRINVVKSPESLHEVFPKCLLPKDLGGEQKTMLELFGNIYINH
ncbi:uncharacterized protein LOC134748794 [Cydia strobilella]|uniref:uncharacterized protein LOC134748794 n=1 Tax=Cydia strobilella TaxID=1100964 RepID=UPI003006E664